MSNLSEEQQAMMLFQMMAQVMGGVDDDDDEAPPDDRVQCPVCSTYHEPREGEKEAAKKGEPASHGCLVAYIAAHCPICLEDAAGPPMVCLPCGHLVCQPDFEKLGGYIGEKPSDRPAPRSNNNNRSSSSSSEMDATRFINGLNMMRMLGMPPPFGFPGGFGDDDDDDDDYEDDSDDESCPPLERVGGARGRADSANEDSDDSMPPLEPMSRGAGGGNNANDSDDDSLPHLQRMDGGIANNNNDDGEEADNEEEDDDDSMPPLMPRAVASDEEVESDGEDDDMPPLTARPRTGGGGGNANEGVPDVVGSAESDTCDDCPALERVGIDSSSDEECPAAAAVARGDGDDDDDGMPTLTPRGEAPKSAKGKDEPPALERPAGKKSQSDDENEKARSEIRAVYEVGNEKEEEIPFPVLDRVLGASRAPTTFTRDEYLALPEAQRNLGDGGAWIMIPSDHNEDYSTLVYTNDVKCVHIGVYARESRLIVNDNKSVLISSPTLNSNQSDVWLVTLESSELQYKVPTNAQCVSDGGGGIWALTPTGGTRELSYYNEDSPSGSVVHMLPESSYLIMDPMGGVWAHVRKRGTVEVGPGLFYYVFGMGHNLISQPDQNAKCTTGADGVCVITSAGGQAQLTNVSLGETPRLVTLKNCAASKDIRVVPREKEENDKALYVHCRVQNRWKLCLLDESGRIDEICDCPKDARVVGDGKGGAWIFKRTGANHQMRMLTFVATSGTTRDHGFSFPPGSKIAGL